MRVAYIYRSNRGGKKKYSFYFKPSFRLLFDTHIVLFVKPQKLCLLKRAWLPLLFFLRLSWTKARFKRNNAEEIPLIYGQGVKFGAESLKG